jgi:hypothetical protein
VITLVEAQTGGVGRAGLSIKHELVINWTLKKQGEQTLEVKMGSPKNEFSFP